MDAISIERIKTAHPKLRDELQKIYEEANNKLGKARLRFAYVLRPFEEQTKSAPCGALWLLSKKVHDCAYFHTSFISTCVNH